MTDAETVEVKRNAILVTRYVIVREKYEIPISDLGMDNTEDLREDWEGLPADARAFSVVNEGEAHPFEEVWVDTFADAYPAKYKDTAKEV